MAIKIVREDVSKNGQELHALLRIETCRATNHPGFAYLPKLLDYFTHGKKGQHLCLVLELLGPSVSYARPKKGYSMCSALLAVQCLHHLDIVHGGRFSSFEFGLNLLTIIVDIHENNILFHCSEQEKRKIGQTPKFTH